MVANRGDQLSRQTAGDLEADDSAHERDRESQRNFGLATNLVDDHKNFDTMTNPSIKCQDFENHRDQINARHRDLET